MSLSGYPLETGQSARQPVAKVPRSGHVCAVTNLSTEVSNARELPSSLRPARWLSVQVKFEIDIRLNSVVLETWFLDIKTIEKICVNIHVFQFKVLTVNGKNGATGPNATHLVIAATSSELGSAEIQLTEARTALESPPRPSPAPRVVVQPPFLVSGPWSPPSYHLVKMTQQ